MAVMNPLGSRNIIIIDDNYIGEYSQAYMEVGKQIDDIYRNIKRDYRLWKYERTYCRKII